MDPIKTASLAMRHTKQSNVGGTVASLTAKTVPGIVGRSRAAIDTIKNTGNALLTSPSIVGASPMQIASTVAGDVGGQASKGLGYVGEMVAKPISDGLHSMMDGIGKQGDRLARLRALMQKAKGMKRGVNHTDRLLREQALTATRLAANSTKPVLGAGLGLSALNGIAGNILPKE